jgi:hypothetical protein
MCFSATGSFALSGVLTGIGASALARNTSRRHVMFAAIPLLFAAQQAAEGVVWLTVDGSTHATIQRVAVFAFLSFALVIWPMWLPVSLQLIERNPARRRMLTGLFWVGALVALCSVVLLTHSPPVAVVAHHSIRYDRSGGVSGPLELPILLAYTLPTVFPFFVSTAYLSRAIGVMLVASLVATALVEQEALTSIWCFFAAALSAVVWVALLRSQPLPAGFPPLGERSAV